MITIVDYGMGNLGSIQNMLKRIGVKCNITNQPFEIKIAKKLILPGVGAFDRAMERINSGGLRQALDQRVLVDKIPVLGICLGMQILTNFSEEGELPGLGWIPASTRRFPVNRSLKVPHMGWNVVETVNSSPLVVGFEREVRFYFVHSYYVMADRSENTVLRTKYGLNFDSAIQCGNVFGAQFHPEKSHRYGMKLLSNFAAI